MFFSKERQIFEIVGVYKGKRGRYKKESFKRSHSSVGIRLSGEGEFFFATERITAKKNQLLYIPSMLEYSQRSLGEEFISVCFIEHGEASRNMELLNIPESVGIADAMKRLYTAWEEKERGYRHRCQSIFCEVLYEAYLLSSEMNEGSNRAYDILKPAMDYIYSAYKDENISVKHLAGLCYVSETYFRRLFKQTLGVSPNAFIRTMKIDTAISLLESGELSIKEAAFAAGFNDAKYFSREFKKAKGVSPANYFKFPDKTA